MTGLWFTQYGLARAPRGLSLSKDRGASRMALCIRFQWRLRDARTSQETPEPDPLSGAINVAAMRAFHTPI